MNSLELEYSEGARSARHNDDASSVEGGTPQLVGMLTENRDLLDKITTMHNKLKLARAKISQLEQTVRSRDAEVSFGQEGRVVSAELIHLSIFILFVSLCNCRPQLGELKQLPHRQVRGTSWNWGKRPSLTICAIQSTRPV